MSDPTDKPGIEYLIFKYRNNPGQWVFSMKDILEMLDDDSMPIEWKKWKRGESDYKPFSLQMTECKESGNLFMEDCCHCGNKLLLCKKYGGQCISGKCKSERIRKSI